MMHVCVTVIMCVNIVILFHGGNTNTLIHMVLMQYEFSDLGCMKGTNTFPPMYLKAEKGRVSLFEQ